VAAGPLTPTSLDGLDLLVLAIPVRAAVERIRRLGGLLGTGADVVITDVGSTKRSIVGAAEAAGLANRFVGSHPMAGSHECGWNASRRGLFHDAQVWLCATAVSEPSAVAAVEELWRAVGAHPRIIDAASHDRQLARTSHLPQLTATALAAVLSRHGHSPLALGPGGRDATRLAGSDPGMWTDIAMDNAPDIRPALEELARELTDLARAVEGGDAADIRARLAAGLAWYDQVKPGR
jgi:prephenate dehydrogenase